MYGPRALNYYCSIKRDDVGLFCHGLKEKGLSSQDFIVT